MILLKSVIIGVLTGFPVGVGVARMYRAPEIQAMGAFRTLGEMNASQGDPVSHFSFGFSWFVNSLGTNAAFGGVDQDILHRVIPNLSAGILLTRDKNPETTIQDPAKMGIVGAIVGAIVFLLLNAVPAFVPLSVTGVLSTVFSGATTNFLIVMQILYLLAALDSGPITGAWGLILGSIAFLVTGNATPGLILGILTGETIKNNGVKSKISIVFIIVMIVVWVLVAYFRGFFPTLIDAFRQLTIGG